MKRAACHRPGKNAVVDFDVDVNRRCWPNRKMEYNYLKQVLIPKVLPKLKILKNEKIIFPDFKLIVLFFWLTSMVDAHWCQRPVNVRQCCQHPFYCLFHHAPQILLLGFLLLQLYHFEIIQVQDRACSLFKSVHTASLNSWELKVAARFYANYI